ncbi:unnamed protein product [Somion occarium]|uniref:Uncharacterized protein n=1 Tax=Somion occarium TaxID=3059160 RepID=A0ABP1ED60_9APHY
MTSRCHRDILVFGGLKDGHSSIIGRINAPILTSIHDVDGINGEVFEFEQGIVTMFEVSTFMENIEDQRGAFEQLSSFLATRFAAGHDFAGIIWQQNISHTRVNGPEREHIALLRYLCGDHALKNLVVATRTCEDIPQEVADAREEELSLGDRIWKPALEQGARLMRDYGATKSAHDIVSALMELSPNTLLIQKQMVEVGLTFPNTTLGLALDSKVNDAADRYHKDLHTVKYRMVDRMVPKLTNEEMQELAKRYAETMGSEIREDRVGDVEGPLRTNDGKLHAMVTHEKPEQLESMFDVRFGRLQTQHEELRGIVTGLKERLQAFEAVRDNRAERELLRIKWEEERKAFKAKFRKMVMDHDAERQKWTRELDGKIRDLQRQMQELRAQSGSVHNSHNRRSRC